MRRPEPRCVFNTVRFERPEAPIWTRLVQVMRSSYIFDFNEQTRPNPEDVASLQTPYLYGVKGRRLAHELYNAECNAPIGSSTNHQSPLTPRLPRPSVSEKAVHEQLERVIKHDRQKNQTQVGARPENQDR
jgi:hypothetical protein